MENPKEVAQKLIENRTFSNALFNLYDRWEDEKMYEDWKDYEKAMKALVETHSGITPTNVKGTKRPFGVKYNHNGFTIHLFIKVKGNCIYTSGTIEKIK